ncbi:hypothetical protein IAD21_02004 [Abditibacteriota bacterium]|nr:hypothetical protein IAD21_02004 [Abditibacteriota bacterium]
MTEQEAEVWAKRLERIWVGQNIRIVGPFVFEEEFIEDGVTEEACTFATIEGMWGQVQVSVDNKRLRLYSMSWTYWIAVGWNGNLTQSCHDESTIRGANQKHFERSWLNIFRRTAWLSGCPIEASAHEKAEWMQGFSREEIEAWNLKCGLSLLCHCDRMRRMRRVFFLAFALLVSSLLPNMLPTAPIAYAQMPKSREGKIKAVDAWASLIREWKNANDVEQLADLLTQVNGHHQSDPRDGLFRDAMHKLEEAAHQKAKGLKNHNKMDLDIAEMKIQAAQRLIRRAPSQVRSAPGHNPKLIGKKKQSLPRH